MCGLVGMIDLRGLDAVALTPRLDAALARLAPRGPDGEGRWADATCLLGHRRLAVIDLNPEAGQPMLGEGFAIVFNGEIYNFAELRVDLAAAGHSFRTRSDTEVLLAGWREWGPDLLPRLRGMFAFAIWDAAARRLTIVRDRFGKKPLVWREVGGALAFASDLRALDLLLPGDGRLDQTALRALFEQRVIPAPATIWRDAQALPPGAMLTADADGVRVSQWYHLPHPEIPPRCDELEAIARMGFLLDQAVRDRLVADVPVGAFLSGGLDSSAICASLVAQGIDVTAYTIGFDGTASYLDERRQAAETAAHLGLRHEILSVCEDEALAAVPGVLEAMDQPFADSSAIPAWLVAKAMRREVTVALSGDGADELLGGYVRHQGLLHAARWQRQPGWLRGLVRTLARTLPEGREGLIRPLVRKARRFVDGAERRPEERQLAWMRHLPEDDVDRLLLPLERGDAGPDLALAKVKAAMAGLTDPINAALAAEMAVTLPDDMLVKVDRMGMAHGLEIRSPFLDDRLVAFALSLPGALKVKPGKGKDILRAAVFGRLPMDIIARPKRGFEAPLHVWLRGSLRELAMEMTAPARLRQQNLFDPDLPRQWLEGVRAGRRDTAWAVWTMIVFQSWWDRRRGGP